MVFYLMCMTCIGILIRSVFRIAEFAGGYVEANSNSYHLGWTMSVLSNALHRYRGTIATHEGYFYAFDTLPLWVAMTLYCIVWPTRAFIGLSWQRLQDATNSALELKPTSA
jgi:hypothetical protein